MNDNEQLVFEKLAYLQIPRGWVTRRVQAGIPVCDALLKHRISLAGVTLNVGQQRILGIAKCSVRVQQASCRAPVESVCGRMLGAACVRSPADKSQCECNNSMLVAIRQNRCRPICERGSCCLC